MSRYPYAWMSKRWQMGLKALLLAFLLRAMVPVGYMPVFFFAGHAPALTITLCVKGLPDHVVQTLSLDTHDHHAEPQQLDCAFGAATAHAHAPPPSAVSLPAQAPAFVVPLSRAAHAAHPRRSTGPPLGPRAPPLTA